MATGRLAATILGFADAHSFVALSIVTTAAIGLSWLAAPHRGGLDWP